MSCPDWIRKDMRKTSVTNTGSKTKSNVRDMGSLFHGAKGYADGGEVETLKQEGLKASAGESVSLWDRLKAGNIDDPNSQAYKQFGAGRGQRERDYNAAEKELDNLDAMKKADAARASQRESNYDAAEKEIDKLDAMKAAAPKAKPKAAVKTKAPDYARPDPNENESPAETARLKRQSKEAGERAEASTPAFGRPKRKTPEGGVTPRPMLNWSTPADRARWDEKYKATHNADGTPK